MDDGRGAGIVLTSIRTVAETGSTNADMLALARDGAPEGMWLRAERQSGGRGRQGRAWASPAGNLYASTVIRVRPGDPPAPTLALVVSVALEEVVGALLRSSLQHPGPGLRRGGLQLKWPNDLLVGGAKISGILLERAGDAIVVGVGVNVAHHPDLPERPTTSLAAQGVAITPAALLDRLAEALAAWIAIWRTDGLAAIVARWTERAHPVGTPLIARLSDDSAVEGTFDGLAPDGGLRLRLADGSAHVIHAADVFLV